MCWNIEITEISPFKLHHTENYENSAKTTYFQLIQDLYVVTSPVYIGSKFWRTSGKNSSSWYTYRLQCVRLAFAEDGLLMLVTLSSGVDTRRAAWSGARKERREVFAIKSHLFSKLSGLPKGTNDRLMTMRLPLSGKRHATILSASAPTMTNSD